MKISSFKYAMSKTWLGTGPGGKFADVFILTNPATRVPQGFAGTFFPTLNPPDYVRGFQLVKNAPFVITRVKFLSKIYYE